MDAHQAERLPYLLVLVLTLSVFDYALVLTVA